jgi:hypothetical protein
LFVFAAQLVQVAPRVQAGVVPVIEYEPHGIVADRFDFRDLDIVFANLQRLLPGPMTANLGRRRVDAQVFKRQLERRTV